MCSDRAVAELLFIHSFQVSNVDGVPKIHGANEKPPK